MTLDTLKTEALQVSCIDWAIAQGWRLTTRGNDRSGPCPVCGGHEKKDSDRFSINIPKNVFNCRKCGVGGDVIRLVRFTEQLEFKEALERITGRKAAEPVDPERQEQLKKEAAKKRAAQERAAERYRQRQRKAGMQIVSQARQPKPDGPLEQYLRIRGLGKLADTIAAGKFPIDLGEILDLERRCQVKTDRGSDWEVVDRSPAMVARIMQPGGEFGAAHITYLDLAEKKGKRVTIDPNTKEQLPSKIVLGSKKGGAILLYTPPEAERIVMGEGIETTLTAMQEAFEKRTAYWCGVDLGNMAGPTGFDEDGVRRHDIPDLDARAFVPPVWCKEFVILRDGDSESGKTDKMLKRCGRRAMMLRPGLVAKIANAEPGKDFNDMLVGDADE